MNKGIARNEVKHATAFDANFKRLGLKSNEQLALKYEFINERMGLAMPADKLLAFFNEDGSERMLHMMILDKKTRLDVMKYGGWRDT